MRVLRLAALVLLSLVGASCGSVASKKAELPCPASCQELPKPLENGRLPAKARPKSYALELAIDPSKERFSGRARITIDVPEPTLSIVLHASDLRFSRAIARGASGEIPLSVSMRRAAQRMDEDELVLQAKTPLDQGEVTLELAYDAPFADGNVGLFRLREADSDYAFTQFEPADARRVFPCFDEPGWKVPFSVRVRVPKGMEAFANTALVSRTPEKDGLGEVFAFAPSAPLPTYLVALAVGPLEVRRGARVGDTEIRLITTHGKSKLGDAVLEVAAKELAFLERYAGRAYPYKKLDLVAVPDLSAYAMEHPGLVTFREDLILQNPRAMSVFAEREMASVVAHELAHQWFGNLVTMPWWNELWLNEGFATWMADKAQAEVLHDEAAPAFAVSMKYTAMRDDELGSAHAVEGPITTTTEAADLFDTITYEKGAALVTMLEGHLGEETMQRALREHFQAFASATASSSDLLASLGRVSKKDLSRFSAGFLRASGVPLVRAELRCEPGKKPEARLGLDKPSAWQGLASPWVPVCVAFEGGKAPVCGELSDTLTLPLASESDPCPAWMYPNAREQGYYRFALPPSGIDALGAHATALGARERTGLLANARALLFAGQIQEKQLLGLLRAFAKEKEPAALAELAETLRWLRKMSPSEAKRAELSRLSTSLFGPIVEELGWQTSPDDRAPTRLARVIALSALGSLSDDAKIRQEAEKRAIAYLKDPTNLDPDTTAVALLIAARNADEAWFAALQSRLKQTKEPAMRTMLARTLGALGDAALFGRGLDAALSGELSAAELLDAFAQAETHDDARAWALAWIDGHSRELRHVLDTSMLLELSALVGEVCDAPTQTSAVAFFTAAFQALDANPRRLSMHKERAERCIATAKRIAAEAP